MEKYQWQKQARRFDERQVQYIRYLHSIGVKQAEIARVAKVAPATIYKIVHYERYRDVEPLPNYVGNIADIYKALQR